jgi:putative ABC transport system permease protein
VFPLWLWLAGIGFAALFAGLGAFGPARAAARTDPAVALTRA